MIKLKNTDKAVKRLILALKNNEKIGVWSDYDPDGVFALVLSYEALLNANFKKENIVLILPEQKIYSRSFNKYHLNFLKDKGVNLILGTDFGTSDFEQTRMAKKMGFEIILLDHHRQRPGNLPATLINPWQKGDRSKYKNWSGTGVAYLFFENLYKKLKMDIKKLEQSLDLILIPAITDYIKIDRGNLPYFKKSIQAIQKIKRPGITIPLKTLGIKEGLDSFLKNRAELSNFYGSLKKNNEENNIFKLLISNDKKDIAKQSLVLKKLIDKLEEYTDRFVKLGVKKFKNSDQKFIFWGTTRKMKYYEALSKVANELNIRFKEKPVYFYAKENEHIKGSARGNFSNFNLVDSLKGASQFIINFGGHPKAAGFICTEKKLSFIKKALEKFYNNEQK